MRMAQLVDALMEDCLYVEGELPAAGGVPPEAVVVEGIARTFAFHPQRIAAHQARIATLCAELPENFHRSQGGGWSFLQLCETKSGEQWGDHPHCEALLALAQAAGLGGMLTPRALWPILPGGLPYVWLGL